ncbi:MAG: ATP-dependent DNA helicase, partial [Methanosphaera sp. rholeuAM74]
SKTRYMEHVGTGIKRMKDAMIAHGLDEPEFAENGMFFEVTFRSHVEDKNLNDRQKEFLRFKDKSEITIKEYAEIFDIVRNTATKDLNELVDKNLLEKIKNGKQLLYKKK